MIAKLAELHPTAAAPAPGVGPAFSLPASAFTFEGFHRWRVQVGDIDLAKVSFKGGAITIEDQARGTRFSIPPSALSPAGFRDWVFTGDYPPRGRVEYIGGEIYIDMNSEAIQTHAKVKIEITTQINVLVTRNNLGLVYPDGTLVVNQIADVSNEPDACFCSWESLQTLRVRESPKPGRDDGEALCLEGSVDWVLEVISKSSVGKDNRILKEKYFRAGVREYCMIDAREGGIEFGVFSPGKTKFSEQAHRGGWVASPLFQRKFSLQRRDYQGFWRFELLVAPIRQARKA